jgi:hypothetical protein
VQNLSIFALLAVRQLTAKHMVNDSRNSRALRQSNDRIYALADKQGLP